MDFETTVVERIRALANQKGYSLTTLEAKLGLGNGTISRWNKSSPNTDKISKVADFFNVSVDYLLGREAEDERSIGLDNVFFSIAKDAQDSGIDPEDLRMMIDFIKKKEKR